MKLPSITNLVQQAKLTFLRFPFVILTSILGAFLMMRVIGFSHEYAELHAQTMYNIVMMCSLGLPLFLSFALYSESKGFSRVKGYLLQIVPLILLILFYFSLSKEMDVYDLGRYFLFLIAFHLLVSFSPYLLSGEKSQLDFWDFNQKTFQRFILSALYSGVLYAGLAVALLSFDKLFEMHIDGKRYAQLFFFIAGVFNTWFFCSGVSEFKETGEFKFPKGLKIFTQYVLLPIVVIYVVILYLYLFKIIFQWNLPSGWVSYLVIGFSTAGIFSLLLIFPLVDSKEIKWVRIFSRVFFVSLIPQIVLLYLAIFKRTSEYGMTEKRYYVIVLAGWLTITTLYYVVSNFRNIKFIPVTLFLIAVLTSYGPWSSFTLSLNSQLNRLEEILRKNTILVDGKIVPAKSDVNIEEATDVRSILQFLVERKKVNKIQPWFTESLDSITDRREYGKTVHGVYVSKEEEIMMKMGIKTENTENLNKRSYANISTKNIRVVDVKGFDKFIVYDISTPDSVKIQDSMNTITPSFNYQTSEMYLYDSKDTLKIPVKDIAGNVSSLTPDISKMTFDYNFKNYLYRIIFTSLIYERKDNELKINYMKAYILQKRKQE
ncbi:MAG: DUF4153 domain-containing protein [Ignavibacteriota bacterium]|nr:DUF4153 domain-containing protein [Ignavibacteriota bacterium]